MIDLHRYLMFIGAAVILVIAPGPDMAYMLTRTVAQGRRAGIFAALGINAGAYVHVTAAVLGLTVLVASSSVAFTAIKLAGACYLIWIGIQALRAKSDAINVEGGLSQQISSSAIFWQGFLSDVLNPKVAIFFLAFLPQFIELGNQKITVTQQLLLLGVTCNVIALSINLVLVHFASVATKSLRKNRRLVSWLNKTAGAVFIGLGIRLGSERL